MHRSPLVHTGTFFDKYSPGMYKKRFYTVVLLMAAAIGLHAQEHVDTVTIKPKPITSLSLFSGTWQPVFPSLEGTAEESKEERAARINRETYTRVMASVQQNLSWHQPAKLSKAEMALLFVGGLFLNSPYKFRPGTVPLMNASNPFVYATIPGKAPYAHPYSSEFFPQCISAEYDFRTGTYQQVMVKWDEVERSMDRSYGGPYRNDPVPKMQFRSSEWLVP